jgi:hypothetical protein
MDGRPAVVRVDVMATRLPHDGPVNTASAQLEFNLGRRLPTAPTGP